MVASNCGICIAVTVISLTVTPSLCLGEDDWLTSPPTPSPPIRGCYIGHNVDLKGNDFDNVRATASNQCCGVCAGRSGCKAWTWTNHAGGTCWLKSRGSSAVSVNVGADSCIMNSDEAVMKTFTDCDMPGNDFYSTPAVGVDLCGHYCSHDKACKAATWSSGTCYLKYDVRECVFKAGVASSVVFNHFVSL